MRKYWGASAVVVAVMLGGCSSGSAPAAVTKTVTRTKTVTTTVTPEPADTSDDTSDDAGDAGYTPTKSDFKLSLKILSKECFGSAGCDISFRVEPAYSGDEFDPSKTAEVTYEIIGSEDDYTNTFTMTGDTNASVDREESVQTGTAGKISVKITDVELVDYGE